MTSFPEPPYPQPLTSKTPRAQVHVFVKPACAIHPFARLAKDPLRKKRNLSRIDSGPLDHGCVQTCFLV